MADRIGASGLTDDEFMGWLAKASAARDELRSAYAESSLALLRLPERRDDIEPIKAAAERLARGASDIVFLGAGGSSLGGQALAQLTGWRTPGTVIAGRPGEPRLHFMDNLDPASIDAALTNLDLKATRFVAVSKSGNTAETVMQMLAAIEALKHEALDWNIANHFIAVSEPPSDRGANAIRQLAAFHSIPVIDHDRDVGGRFSVLSVVGALPACLMGLDPVVMREGAAMALKTLLEEDDPAAIAPLVGAAVNAAFLARGHTIAAMMLYADRLAMFARWYAQLWAESLGKDGRGSTPVTAIGPSDQHSQLQLFLDGPADKLFTVVELDVAHKGPRVPETFVADPEIGYLAGKTIGDLVDCEQRATVETLARAGRPVRVLRLPGLNERVLGGLFMHFMLETIIMGRLIGVNVFDQPAVEAGKVLVRDYLRDI